MVFSKNFYITVAIVSIILAVYACVDLYGKSIYKRAKADCYAERESEIKNEYEKIIEIKEKVKKTSIDEKRNMLDKWIIKTL